MWRQVWSLTEMSRLSRTDPMQVSGERGVCCWRRGESSRIRSPRAWRRCGGPLTFHSRRQMTRELAVGAELIRYRL